jgi:hypothetical protein
VFKVAELNPVVDKALSVEVEVCPAGKVIVPVDQVAVETVAFAGVVVAVVLTSKFHCANTWAKEFDDSKKTNITVIKNSLSNLIMLFIDCNEVKIKRL